MDSELSRIREEVKDNKNEYKDIGSKYEILLKENTNIKNELYYQTE